MRKFRQYALPTRCDPLVRQLFAELNRQQMLVCDLADKSGIGRDHFREWRSRRTPRVNDLEACFNVLGFTLKAVRREAGR